MEIIIAAILGYVVYRFFSVSKEKKLDKARTAILSLIEQALLMFGKEAEKSQEYPSIWHLLTADFVQYRAAIKAKPDDLLIVLFSGMLSSIALFEARRSSPDESLERMLLNSITDTYGSQMLTSTAALIRLHGGTIQPHEEEYAKKFINSLKFDDKSRKFVSAD